MRSLAVTDCTGMPNLPQEVTYGNTYVGKLEQLGAVTVLSGGGYRLGTRYEHLENVSHGFQSKYFDTGVVQVGIGDCAPRPIPYLMGAILSMSPKWFITINQKILHSTRPFIQNIKYWQYTPKDKFERQFCKLLDIMQDKCKRVIVIGLIPVNDYVAKRNPQFRSQIKIYNDLLKEISTKYNFEYVDISGIPMCDLTDDAHLKIGGYKFVWEKLQDTLVRQ